MGDTLVVECKRAEKMYPNKEQLAAQHAFQVMAQEMALLVRYQEITPNPAEALAPAAVRKQPEVLYGMRTVITVVQFS